MHPSDQAWLEAALEGFSGSQGQNMLHQSQTAAESHCRDPTGKKLPPAHAIPCAMVALHSMQEALHHITGPPRLRPTIFHKPVTRLAPAANAPERCNQLMLASRLTPTGPTTCPQSSATCGEPPNTCVQPSAYVPMQCTNSLYTSAALQLPWKGQWWMTRGGAASAVQCTLQDTPGRWCSSGSALFHHSDTSG
jgi:hypothetical protein